MKLYKIELPEPIPENTLRAIQIARDIHQNAMNYFKRNTKKRKWDEYWVKIYNLVLEQLPNKIKVTKNDY